MRRIAGIVLGLSLLIAGSASADCESNADCKGNRLCVNKRCRQPQACTNDKECSGDDVCEQRVCAAPQRSSPAPAPAPAQPSSAPPAARPVVDNPPRGQVPPATARMSPSGYTGKTWPISMVDQPLVLAPKMIEAALILAKDLSSMGSNSLGLGLYGYYGVTKEITAGVGNLSICATGCGGGSTLQSLSLDAKYLAVGEPDRNLVPEISLLFQSFSPSVDAGLSLGAEMAWKVQPDLQVWVNPRFTLGVLGRANTQSPDSFIVSAQPRLRVTPALTLLATVAFFIPLEVPGDWIVPLGIGANYGLQLNGVGELSLGADFTLGSVIPHIARGPGIFDVRLFRIYAIARL